MKRLAKHLGWQNVSCASSSPTVRGSARRLDSALSCVCPWKDRAVPGRWEGDLIFGKKMTSIGTLVERHSRFVVLLKLPNGHGAEAVRKGHDKRILTLPAQLRRSITWDPGKEMAEHVRFTVDTGLQNCFCNPKSPGSAGRQHQQSPSSVPAAIFRPLATHPSESSTPSLAHSTRGLDRPPDG